MKFENLKIGKIYRGNKPKLIGIFFPQVDDRQILHITSTKHPIKSGGTATISIFNDKDISVDVYIHDIKGQPYGYKKIDFKIGENKIEFSTEGYAGGTYFISGYTELGNFFEKIVVYK